MNGARCSGAFATCAPVEPKPFRTRLGRGWLERAGLSYDQRGGYVTLTVHGPTMEADLRVRVTAKNANRLYRALDHRKQYELVLREVRK